MRLSTKCFLVICIFSVNSAAITSANATTLNNGLTAWFPFNGNANDKSGNGNDGTVQNASLTQDRNSSTNAAYNFTGTDSSIDIGNNVKPTLPHTVNLWFRTARIGSMPLFRNDRFDNGSNRNGTFLGIGTNGELFVYAFSGFAAPSTRYAEGTDPGAYELGEWTMFTAINASRGNQKIFVNGAQVATTPGTGTATVMRYSSESGAIGQIPATRRNRETWSSTSFDGDIDDVGVWSRPLTDGEVLALFKGEDPLGNVASVPVPATIWFLGLGLAALAGMARRSRQLA